MTRQMLVSCTTMNIDMNKNWKIELQSISFVFMSFPIQPRVARKKKKKTWRYKKRKERKSGKLLKEGWHPRDDVFLGSSIKVQREFIIIGSNIDQYVDFGRKWQVGSRRSTQ